MGSGRKVDYVSTDGSSKHGTRTNNVNSGDAIYTLK